MRNEMLESLPNTDSKSNDFMKIYRESGSLDELHMATYTRAMQPDCFELYQLIPEPFPPTGWREAYEEYRSLKGDEAKSKIWKKMQEQFKGYLKVRENAFCDTQSNKSFLIEMMEFFEKNNQEVYVRKIAHRLKYFGFIRNAA